MNDNGIISEIGGVTMKTLDEIKPVIDGAVESAGRIRDGIAESKESILDKDAPDMESSISVQDAPETAAEAAEPEIPGRQAPETEKDAMDGPSAPGE